MQPALSCVFSQHIALYTTDNYSNTTMSSKKGKQWNDGFWIFRYQSQKDTVLFVMMSFDRHCFSLSLILPFSKTTIFIQIRRAARKDTIRPWLVCLARTKNPSIMDNQGHAVAKDTIRAKCLCLVVTKNPSTTGNQASRVVCCRVVCGFGCYFESVHAWRNGGTL